MLSDKDNHHSHYSDISPCANKSDMLSLCLLLFDYNYILYKQTQLLTNQKPMLYKGYYNTNTVYHHSANTVLIPARR